MLGDWEMERLMDGEREERLVDGEMGERLVDGEMGERIADADAKFAFVLTGEEIGCLWEAIGVSPDD